MAQISEERLARLEAMEKRSKKYWVKNQLLLVKARKAGIVVTEKEIDEYLAAQAKAKK